MSACPTQEPALAHDRAVADWMDAEGLVAALRRSTAAAVERAAERAQATAMLLRAGRRDAFALGVADAAQVLAQRAAAERRRLEAAVREESLLRARVAATRVALVAAMASSEPERGRRLRCG